MPNPGGLTWSAVGARRLERNLLAAPSPDGTPADVAAAMGAAHAQVLAAGEVSIAMRMAAGTRADVQAALWRDHDLVKTYALRGTVHLVAAGDLPMWTAVLASLPGPMGLYPEGVRLTDAESARLVAAIADTVEGGADLTNEELEREIVARVGAWAAEPSVDAFTERWPRWRLAVHPAVAAGVLCFGPNRGAKVTWTSVRRLVPDFTPMDSNEAVAELLRRYLRAYGPSTPAWFDRWVAATKRWADDAFDRIRDELAQVEVEGTRAWILADDRDFPTAAPRGVRLLPHYDTFTIAWRPRELMFPGVAAERGLSRGAAGWIPLLLVDGVVAGVWKRSGTAKKLRVEVEPFGELRAAQRDELGAQVARLGQIWGADAELVLGPIST